MNYVGLLYIHQITVFLNDQVLTNIKRADVDWISTMANLGLFFLTDLSALMNTLLTFTFIFNKNEHEKLSSVTYFIWGNAGIEDITLLEGRFKGVFCLRLKDSSKISTIEDVCSV